MLSRNNGSKIGGIWRGILLLVLGVSLILMHATEVSAMPDELTFVQPLFDGVGGVDGLAGARSVVVSPDAMHVYVTGYHDDAVAAFSRDSVTGELASRPPVFDGVDGVDGLNGACNLTISPDGAHVYVTGFLDHAVAAFSRDPSTGELSFVDAYFDDTEGVLCYGF